MTETFARLQPAAFLEMTTKAKSKTRQSIWLCLVILIPKPDDLHVFDQFNKPESYHVTAVSHAKLFIVLLGSAVIPQVKI